MLAVLWRGWAGLTVRVLLTPFCEIPNFKRLLYHLLSLLYLATKASGNLPFLRVETPVRKESGALFQAESSGAARTTCHQTEKLFSQQKRWWVKVPGFQSAAELWSAGKP